ncbi:hypothetical protein AB0M02_27300 [Actinoplanes sp. NPDC051861]|uniref:hypothetical protein n=1 Tax=Actinoplanes sp. NPDC051861 TaxID=3155170 RepID=UPI0034394E71
MDSARPLRDVFADLTGSGSAGGDPAELLRDQGHPGLPDDLVAEAVVSYADTAPAEVAEHLAPYVTAHSVAATPADAGPGWLDLLATAPAGPAPEEFDDVVPASGDAAPGLDLDFGTGAEPLDEFGDELVDAPVDLVTADLDPADLDGATEPWTSDVMEMPDVPGDGEPDLDEPDLDLPG